MRKIKLDNIYESPTPLENINDLWGDIDKNTGELLAIHKYNPDKGEWEPKMVSVDYMKPDDSEERDRYWVTDGTTVTDGYGGKVSVDVLKDDTDKIVYVYLVGDDWVNPADQISDGKPCAGHSRINTSSSPTDSGSWSHKHPCILSNGDTVELAMFLGTRHVNSGVEDYSTIWLIGSKIQYEAFKTLHPTFKQITIKNKFPFIAVFKEGHQ